MKTLSQIILRIVIVFAFVAMLIKACFAGALHSIFSRLSKAGCLCVLFTFLIILNLANAQDQNTGQVNADESTDDESTEPAPFVETYDFVANDIAAMMHDDQYTLIELTLPPDPSLTEPSATKLSFPVFSVASKLPLVSGTFVLISDASTNGTNVHGLMSLGRQLAHLGWNSIIMPAPSFNRVIADATAKEQAAQTASSDDVQSDPLEPVDRAGVGEEVVTQSQKLSEISALHYQSYYESNYRQSFNRYLSASVNAVLESIDGSGYTILLAQGMSAQAILQDRAKSSDTDTNAFQVDAIVINNPFWPDRATNKTLPKLVATHKLPLLDLVSEDDNKWAIATQNDRKNQARIHLKPHYRQRQVDSLTVSNDMSSELVKEIYGWLTYLGW